MNTHCSDVRRKNHSMCQHKTLSSASAGWTIICCFVYWLSLNVCIVFMGCSCAYHCRVVGRSRQCFSAKITEMSLITTKYLLEQITLRNFHSRIIFWSNWRSFPIMFITFSGAQNDSEPAARLLWYCKHLKMYPLHEQPLHSHRMTCALSASLSVIQTSLLRSYLLLRTQCLTIQDV